MKTTAEFNEMMYLANQLVEVGVITADELLDLTIKDYDDIRTKYKMIMFGLTTFTDNVTGKIKISIN